MPKTSHKAINGHVAFFSVATPHAIGNISVATHVAYHG
jgi:hypothetical protein